MPEHNDSAPEAIMRFFPENIRHVSLKLEANGK